MKESIRLIVFFQKNQSQIDFFDLKFSKRIVLFDSCLCSDFLSTFFKISVKKFLQKVFFIVCANNVPKIAIKIDQNKKKTEKN